MFLRLAAVKIFEYSLTANAVQKFMQIFHSLGFLPPSLPLCSLFGNSCLLFSPAWLLLFFCLLVIFVALVFNLKFDLWMIICNDMRKWAGNMRSTHTHKQLHYSCFFRDIWLHIFLICINSTQICGKCGGVYLLIQPYTYIHIFIHIYANNLISERVHLCIIIVTLYIWICVNDA